MELAIKIISFLIVVVPLIWTIYNRWFSKQAAEKKRRAQEDDDAQKRREENQTRATDEGRAHNAQEEAERKWRENQRK